MRLKHISRFLFAFALISALSYNIGSFGYSEVPAGDTAGAQDNRFKREWDADDSRSDDQKADQDDAEIIDTTKPAAPAAVATSTDSSTATQTDTSVQTEVNAAKDAAEETHSLGSSQYAIETLPAAAGAGVAQPQVSTTDEALKALDESAAADQNISDVVPHRSVWVKIKDKLRSFKHRIGEFFRSRFGKRAGEETQPTSESGSAQFAIEQMPPSPGLPQMQGLPPLPAPRLPAPEPTAQPAAVPSVTPIEPAPRPPVLAEPAAPAPTSGLATPLAASSVPSAITSLNQLEAEMNQASQKLDFETAIGIRDSIRELMKNPDVKLMSDLDREMREAATNLDFERAIQLRDRIRTLEGKVQITIRREPGKAPVVEIPKPVVPEVKFTVNQFTITGNEAVRTEELQPLLDALVGREITLTDIRNAASEMKSVYRKKGYIAAYVYIPPQAVKDGGVEVRVIEGRLGKIEVQGNRYFSTGLIQNMVQRFGLEPGELISTELLKNSLNQVNKHRDIQTKAILQPGQEKATTDLLVQVEDRSPFHASVDFNNFGTRLTGENRLGTTITDTNLTGRLDELTGRFQGSDGSYAIAADYNMPLFDYDQRLGFAFMQGDIDLGGDFKALNVEGHATTYSGYFVQPLWKNAHIFGDEIWDTTARIGYDHKDVENRILDTTAGRDELRIVNTVFNVEETDAYGKTFIPNSFHFGIDAFGASEKNNEGLTRAASGAPFFIYRALIDRFLYLPVGMMLGFHGSVQLTPDELPSSEQFQLGGVGSVRGYPQGEYLGDSGASAQAELLVPSYFIPEDWRLFNSKRPLREEIKWVGFYDIGTADLRGALPGEASEKDMSGAGFGVRMRLFDKFTSRVEYAYPLADKTSDGSKGALYYGLSYDVL